MEDKRFSHIATDPKFRRIPKNERKVKIDKRFQGMFNDKKFKVKYTVDKRGRPVNQTSTEDLKRYYDLSSEEEESSSEDEENAEEESTKPGKYVKPPKTDTADSTELNVKLKSDPKIPKTIKKKLANLKVDYARGEASLLSESSSDDDESEEDDLSESEEIDHKWGELDNDADSTEEATYRLAACNMDWDRMRATDLMVLLNSFVPPGGAIKSVIIYPSEFGKKRMQEEEVKGPIELVEAKEDEEVEEDTEEGSKYHMEKLRKYQLNRLKYFYAVIICDSANTANSIYTECDGMEYESSSTKIDLRFIPDDMTFDDEPKEICDKLPELNKYQPRFFTTTALQQAKVDLTWDETDPDRIELTQKLSSGRIEDISKNDLQNYLAGSSDDEEDSENEAGENSESENDSSNANPIDKYKLLLQEIEDKETERKNKEVEMEVSWGIDLKDKTEKLVKKKLDEKQEKTPFEQYLDKRKEKRKEKRKSKKNEGDDQDSDIPSDIDMNDSYFAEEFQNPEFSKKKSKAKKKIDDGSGEEADGGALELLLMNEEDDGKAHFSLKKIQAQENSSKNKKKNKNKTGEVEKADDFQVNVDDDRFSALFTSHLYNIDPTDPHYKKTKAMDTLISEKFKRRTDAEEPPAKRNKTENKKDAELSVLVKSVKRKTQALQNSKKNK